MVGGVQGFAEGFSGGLNQGLGIMRSFRDEKRRDEQLGLQRRQAEQSMELARNQDDRAQTTFEGQQEDRKWTNENVRPLTLDQLKLSVDKYRQDIELGDVNLAMANINREWLPKEKEQSYDLRQKADARADRSEARADRAQNFQEYSWGKSFDLSSNAQAFQQASSILPIYSSLVADGLPVPPQMEEIMQKSPFGVSNMVEYAEASAHFPQILGMAAKGNFSFMGNPDMKESAFALARPTGMRIARDSGLDMMSARVTDFTILPGQMGMVGVKVYGYDPKTHTYRSVVKAAPMDAMAQQMQVNARSGEALRNHPKYSDFANYAGVARVMQAPQLREQARQEYFKLAEMKQEAVKAGTDLAGNLNAAASEARRWLDRYSSPDKYADAVASGVAATRSARAGDLSRFDSSRVYATAVRYTGETNYDDAMRNANKAMRVVGALGDRVNKKSAPGLSALAHATKFSYNDPASMVRFYYEAVGNDKTAKELKSILGGSGKGNPSGGRVNARPVADASSIAKSIYPGVQITQNRRDPNSSLGKANPKSWHNHSGAAIDVRPVKGMSFNDFVSGFRAKGYKIIEAIDEVAHPSKHATGAHWHIVLGQ